MVEMNPELRRARREISYALIGTGITLVLALLLYWAVPEMKAWMRDRHSENDYSRLVTMQGNTMQIQYAAKNDHVSPAELQLNAELLGRRFARGDFSLLTVPDSTLAEALTGLQAVERALSVSVKSEGNSWIVAVQAGTPAATKALDTYAAIIKENWHEN